MSLAFFERSSVYTTNNATSQATATSFTPAAHSLMVAFVCASSTETTESDPSGVTGNGATYTKLSTTLFVSGVGTISIWVADSGASPTAGAITATWAVARTGVSISVFEITGADLTGGATAAVVSTNIKTGSGTATSGSITMNAAGASGNLCLGFFDHTVTESIAAGASNTLGSTGSYATPARGAGSVFNTSAFANPAASWTTSGAWRGMGIEVKVASGVTTVTSGALDVTGAAATTVAQPAAAILALDATGTAAITMAKAVATSGVLDATGAAAITVANGIAVVLALDATGAASTTVAKGVAAVLALDATGAASITVGSPILIIPSGPLAVTGAASITLGTPVVLISSGPLSVAGAAALTVAQPYATILALDATGAAVATVAASHVDTSVLLVSGPLDVTGAAILLVNVPRLITTRTSDLDFDPILRRLHRW